MRRLLAVCLLLAAVGAAALASTGAGGRGGDYKVRAIFDNAGFVIPGEDVKVAGVKVGKIDSLDVTPDNKAAVVLKITDPGYQDFRGDATCVVRPQSLIGERFVECKPTQQHAVGEPPAPPLHKITHGPGEGQYLLPVTNTQKNVDIDLISGIMREPETQRLSIILNELGTGLAGRGRDLNDVIRRANPALKETDHLLRILGSQNRVLSELARNSDIILAPLARDRRRVAGAIRNSSAVAEATAERRGDLEADIRRLPRFLDELKPTMVRVSSLSDEMTPVLSDLHSAAPDINRLLREAGPFSQAGIPALKTLGDAAKAGTPAVKDARPVIAELRNLANSIRPVGLTGRQVLESFQRTHGIERLMDYIFYQATAINGFDAVSHYLRAALIVNQCSSYAVDPVQGCSANFQPSASPSAAGASGPRDPVLARTAAALRRSLGKEIRKAHHHHHARKPAARKRRHHGRRSGGGGGSTRTEAPRPGATGTPAPSAQPTPGAQFAPAQPAPAPSASASPTATPPPQQVGGSPSDALLDYLFGKGGR